MRPRTATTLSPLLFAASLLSARAAPFSTQVDDQQAETEDELFRDDKVHWFRFMDGAINSLHPNPTHSPLIPAATPSPTGPPSPSPSQDIVCDSQATITCNDENGLSCDEIAPVKRECEAGETLKKLRFRLEFNSCDESSNTQAAFIASCVDSEPLPANEGEVVRVTCLNVANNSLLFSDTAFPGDDITISAESGVPIPDEVNCSIFSEAGNLLQSLTIDTSGQDDLYLKDQYGSLTLEGCNSQLCTEEVTYTYTVQNTGNTTLTVTKFARARNGEQEVLLPDQTPFELIPGDSLTAEEVENVDLCIGTEYFTVLEVGTVPDCPSEADYFFPVLTGCLVDVQINCKTADGVECSEMEIPSGSEDCNVEVSYKYDLANVGNSAIEITTFERTRNGETVSLMEMLTDKNLVPGESISAVEKETINVCKEAKYQTEVLAEAEPPSGLMCFDEELYKLNIGAPHSTLEPTTSPNSNLTPEASPPHASSEPTSPPNANLIPQVTPSPATLKPMTSPNANLIPEATLRPTTSEPTTPPTANLIPEATPLPTPGPTPEPAASCEVSVDMTCATAGGQACIDLRGVESLQCTCPDGCVTGLTYRYTAARCAAGLDGCADSGTNEPTADIVVANGNRVLFEGRVQIEDDVIIRLGNECLPDTLQVLVSPIGGQPASQVVLVDSSCESQGVSLLDNFGAFEFVGYACEDDSVHSCFEEAEYSVLTSNIGKVPLTVANWTFELNRELRGPGIVLPTLALNESFTRIEPAEFNLCADGAYSAGATVTGTRTGGDICEGTDGISFNVSAPPTPSPATEQPTPNPTVAEFIPIPTILPPTTPPTSQEQCVFEMTVECVPAASVASCNATPPPLTQCTGRPFEMGFTYSGGDCRNSWNVQEEAGKFFCNDFNGGPPTERGERSFIVVTDLDGQTIYHSDYVLVGSMFTLYNGGRDFSADQLITIYSKNETEDSTAILQSIQYSSECSQDLFLNDRFGAVQLVLWVNEDQGVVSLLANQTFTLDIAIPADIETATVKGLTVSSNVDPFFFNLTERVFGFVADGGSFLEIVIAIPIDLTEKKTYNMVMTLTAETKETTSCIATDRVSFTAGYPLPPIFPAFAPTVGPS